MSKSQARNLLVRYLEQQCELGADEIVLEPPASAGFYDSDTECQASAQREALKTLYLETKTCQNCALGRMRTNYVFGAGECRTKLMFVGEAPGLEEDRRGLPFVGAAGQLLTKMIEAMGFKREQVFIANILKCRPPNNRDPQPEEAEACLPILKKQIQIIQPGFICALGRIAAQTLLGTTEPVGRLRGRVHDYQGIHLVVTYHPAALLRNPQWKRGAWQDLQLLMRVMGE